MKNFSDISVQFFGASQSTVWKRAVGSISKKIKWTKENCMDWEPHEAE